MNKQLLTLCSCLASASGLAAATMTVSIDGFADPTNFSITSGSNLSLRVTELVPSSGTNASTHILIEGLSPLEDGTLTYASPYSGIDVNNGAVQDTGILYLDMPAGSELPEGTVASPIVGVVQRAGSWDNFALNYPNTVLGGASGEGDYATGTLSFSLVRNTETFTGSTTYTVLDEDTIELEPFTMTAPGPSSIELSGTTMMRDGSRYYGTFTNMSSGAAYDGLIFAVEFSDVPDADFDGIPDISDSLILSSGTLNVGVWTMTSMGYIYGSTADWGYSPYMGHILARFPWIYQMKHGWLYYQGSDAGGHWFYSPSLGWIYADGNDGGAFQSNAGSGWVSGDFFN